MRAVLPGFNPRAPRGARHRRHRPEHLRIQVSIHAPRAGRDSKCRTQPWMPFCFNPRAPRGARPPANISKGIVLSFNPRAPRGARRSMTSTTAQGHCFNPRAPRGARPTLQLAAVRTYAVSIHAPRAGRDDNFRLRTRISFSFNPRAPRGARRGGSGRQITGTLFQSTRPARGATTSESPTLVVVDVSIHAPRAGRDKIIF